ncbi:hypothetical protein GIB67_012574 [Kingdonia uniflora]|uniref:Uncharacterized protein n=1 Tax=Kingdonia uniflora TaxID=39325 RepID=A0A7J7NEU2_9MAGN|nr:hypothetical protein GIB67_012574 [Kingdonia uniflora]
MHDSEIVPGNFFESSDFLHLNPCKLQLGLLDNVLCDYLWAKAVLLTTTTVATAGLTIQVPLAAIVDSLTGHAPHLMDYLGAAAVMVGFVGINIPSGDCSTSSSSGKTEAEIAMREDFHSLPISRDTSSIF